MSRRDLVGEVGTRMTQADHEHRSFSELRGIAVLARMELADPGVELGGENRHLGALERSCCDDHLARLEAAFAGDCDERPAFASRCSSRSIRTPVSTRGPNWAAYDSR